jgi:GxxExxY protein
VELLHADVTEKIIECAFEVHKTLGYGFLEKVYRNAMHVELELAGLKAQTEREIYVLYKGQEVGFYEADLYVNDCVLVEMKIAKSYNFADEAQLLNELKATGTRVGPLINFGRSKVEFKRLFFDPCLFLSVIFRIFLSVFNRCQSVAVLC